MYVFTLVFTFFLFKQKTAYDMRISDWSSDVCSSDLDAYAGVDGWIAGCRLAGLVAAPACVVRGHEQHRVLQDRQRVPAKRDRPVRHRVAGQDAALDWHDRAVGNDDLDHAAGLADRDRTLAGFTDGAGQRLTAGADDRRHRYRHDVRRQIGRE